MARIDEVSEGIYRISTWASEAGISFNQFLIDDERPALIHTGQYPMYERVRKAVAEVMDPALLAYVMVPHFEADECGGMGRFVEEAQGAILACGEVGARINLTQWDFSGSVQGFRDGDLVDLGRRKLRFMETPHVHHWDSTMIFEETTKSLFPADLFIQPGDQPPVVNENLGKEMCQQYREWGIFAARDPVLNVVDRIEKLDLRWVHPMHGGSLSADVILGYARALRNEAFTFEGKLFGRTIPG